MSKPDQPTFTEEQRDRLRYLGLFEAQISQLSNQLALCRSLLKQPATMTVVRAKLTDATKALQGVQALCDGNSAACVEALARIQMAASDMELFGASEVSIALNLVSGAAQRALNSLSQKKRQPITANWIPIQLIEAALLQGFSGHYISQGVPIPAYDISTSRTKKPFPEIVAICYEAIGQKNVEPYRAIREFLAVKKRPRPRPTIKKVVTPDSVPSGPPPVARGIVAEGPFSLVPPAKMS